MVRHTLLKHLFVYTFSIRQFIETRQLFKNKKCKQIRSVSCVQTQTKYGEIYKAILSFYLRLKATPIMHHCVRTRSLYSLNQKCLFAIWAGLRGANWLYCVGNWMCAGSGCVGRTCLLEALCAGGGTTRLYVWYGACDTNTAERR